MHSSRLLRAIMTQRLVADRVEHEASQETIHTISSVAQ